MRSVYYVPGFSAAELWLDRDRRRLYWVDYSRIVLLSPGVMTLDAAGDQAGGRYGVPLYVGDPLTPWWSTIDQLLRRGLSHTDYFVESWCWDWRKDIYQAGRQLADQVRADQLGAGGATLIGHSAGGLVCRAAWHVLNQAGEQSAIRRIITIGTPHFGTYYAVDTFAGVSSFVAQLGQLARISAGYLAGWLAFQAGSITATAIVDVALTWPSLYQLLPLVGASDAAEDPNRELLYDGGEWHGLPGDISLRHLKATRFARDAWLNDPRSSPPAHVMTAVSGTGYATSAGLVRPEVLGLPGAVGSTEAGDSVVTMSSAEGDYPVVVRLTAKHSDLPFALAKSGQLAELVLDERSPATPTPAIVVDTRPVPVEMGEPPIPSPSLLPMWGKTCPRGACTC